MTSFPISKSRLLLAIILLAALSLPGCGGGSVIDAKVLPWDVSLNEKGQVEVFGITLGKSTLTEAARQWRAEARVALFENPQGGRNIEGYFGSLKMGPFSTHMVVRLEVSPELMDRFVAGRLKPAPMPSGVYRYRLNSEHVRQAYELAVAEVTYIPVIASDGGILEQRFGQPAERQDLAEGRSLWLYPDKGMVIILDEGDKEVFQYFNPENYQQVRKRLAGVGINLNL